MKQIGLTERETIAILRESFDKSPRLPLGFDDDVAGYPLRNNQLLILKSDMLVGRTDIPPGMTVRQAARKAIVGAVSDFAAKGVQPRALLTALGLPVPVVASTVRGIARGLCEAAKEYGSRILGGDTSQTDDFIIDCIGFGFADRRNLIPRNGARPGDIVAVTGEFGKTAAGLRILKSGDLRASGKYPTLTRAVLRPVAKLETGLKLAKTGSVTSSIDSSDGLAWSLSEIARLSRVGIIMDEIPIAREAEGFALEKRLVPGDLALYGGEEYELVVTIMPGRFDRVRRLVSGLRRIGRVEKGRGDVRTLIDGKEVRVEPRGYEHFHSDS